MKTELILVGKTNDKLYVNGIKDYTERISHYMPFNITTIPALKNTKNLSEDQQNRLKANRSCDSYSRLTRLFCSTSTEQSAQVWRLVHGFRRSSRQPADLSCHRRTIWFSDAVYKRSDEMISLSRMTFSHQMVRLIFTEQLYRACTIIKGESYHHE